MLLAESLLGSSSAGESVFIEDVFSTWLYTGNSSTRTINNGIDLAGKGGLVWVKNRGGNGANQYSHALWDTARGPGTGRFGLNTKILSSNQSASEGAGSYLQGGEADYLSAFLSNGFTVEASLNYPDIANRSSNNYVSWTFRKQPKFFDIVTFTAPAVGVVATISHSLGSVPGCIIMKSTTNASNWMVLHRYDQTMFGELNTTSAFQSSGFNANFTSTSFEVRGGFNIAANSGTYVAYLFAHNAGGFGATGADNVISCGSFTTDGSGNATVNLGYEPQWVLIKSTSAANDWQIFDVMRGAADVASSGTAILYPNTPDAETTGSRRYPTATGFVAAGLPSTTHIYIAIRRGPMRTPTTGTSVFGLNLRNNATVLSGNVISSPNSAVFDNFWMVNRGTAAAPNNTAFFPVFSRLSGGRYLITTGTNAEGASGLNFGFGQSSLQFTSDWSNFSANYVQYFISRAPGFFDVVCYTGNATSNTQSHNLGVAPELVITKSRNSAQNWLALHTFTASNHQYQFLNTTDAQAAITYASNGFLSSRPTATQLPVTGPYLQINGSGTTYVAYLFASCPGVSKVGTYTGTGATQTIDCGFAAGARFVLIKRTNSTGDWYVWDSARGIVAANDPYLRLNSTAAEVTNTDWVDPAASGFELSNAGGNLANTNGANYIFLAIA